MDKRQLTQYFTATTKLSYLLIAVTALFLFWVTCACCACCCCRKKRLPASSPSSDRGKGASAVIYCLCLLSLVPLLLAFIAFSAHEINSTPKILKGVRGALYQAAEVEEYIDTYDSLAAKVTQNLDILAPYNPKLKDVSSFVKGRLSAVRSVMVQIGEHVYRANNFLRSHHYCPVYLFALFAFIPLVFSLCGAARRQSPGCACCSFCLLSYAIVAVLSVLLFVTMAVIFLHDGCKFLESGDKVLRLAELARSLGPVQGEIARFASMYLVGDDPLRDPLNWHISDLKATLNKLFPLPSALPVAARNSLRELNTLAGEIHDLLLDQIAPAPKITAALYRVIDPVCYNGAYSAGAATLYFEIFALMILLTAVFVVRGIVVWTPPMTRAQRQAFELTQAEAPMYSEEDAVSEKEASLAKDYVASAPTPVLTALPQVAPATPLLYAPVPQTTSSLLRGEERLALAGLNYTTPFNSCPVLAPVGTSFQPAPAVAAPQYLPQYFIPYPPPPAYVPKQ